MKHSEIVLFSNVVDQRVGQICILRGVFLNDFCLGRVGCVFFCIRMSQKNGLKAGNLLGNVF